MNGWRAVCLIYCIIWLRPVIYQRKRGLLAQANSQLDVVRHLWRLAFELETIPARRYQHGARLMEALGQQIGGWRKSQTDPS